MSTSLDRGGIPRAPTGIAGLDGVLRGGLPAHRTTMFVGGPGTGKTVFGLQFLVNGMTRFREQGLLVSFEESADDLAENAAGFPWFPDDPSLRPALIDGRPPSGVVKSGSFDVRGLIAVLDAQTRRLGAKRIVLDGIDELFLGGTREESNQRELYALMAWLESAGLTAIVTFKPGAGTEPTPPLFEHFEYLSKAVVRLECRAEGRLVQRTLRVVKMRGGDFATGDHPFLISAHGLDVAYTEVEKELTQPTNRRQSTGIERLDRMIGGGLREGTVTLISGLPGTAKTTIGGSFLAAGLVRSKRAVLIGFDEPAQQMIFDLESVGIRLAPYEAEGLLRTATFNASGAIADEHYMAIERLVVEHEPALLVIDPISALEKSGGREIADRVCERLVDLVKTRGITAIFTAVSSSNAGESETTPTQVSTVADNWIHLSYIMQLGERNRSLTVIKSRGTGHSHQLRELILGADGVTLRDVYFGEGGVLLGTARLERERRDAAAARAADLAVRAEIEELQRQKASAESRIREAERQLAETTARLEQFVVQAAERSRHEVLFREARLESRQADPATADEAGDGGR